MGRDRQDPGKGRACPCVLCTFSAMLRGEGDLQTDTVTGLSRTPPPRLSPKLPQAVVTRHDPDLQGVDRGGELPVQ